MKYFVLIVYTVIFIETVIKVVNFEIDIVIEVRYIWIMR
jgi:hypothetical protein